MPLLNAAPTTGQSFERHIAMLYAIGEESAVVGVSEARRWHCVTDSRPLLSTPIHLRRARSFPFEDDVERDDGAEPFCDLNIAKTWESRSGTGIRARAQQ